MIPNIRVILVLLGIISLLITASAVLLWREVRLSKQELRAAWATQQNHPMHPQLMARVDNLLRFVGERLWRLYSPGNLEQMRSVIRAAGLNPHRMLPLFLGGKAILMVALPAISFGIAFTFATSMQVRVPIIGLGIILGILGPEWPMGILRRRFTAAVERGTPDALDLLVICSESGMGLESALTRVSQEMQHSNTAMASVLSGFLDDLRVMPNPKDAFTNLGVRSGTEGMRRFGTMLSQSVQYGTSLGNALRAVSQELRRDRMIKLEERAVKLPAKLIFPLILFILPCLWIVLVGPAFLHMADALSNVVSTVK